MLLKLLLLISLVNEILQALFQVFIRLYFLFVVGVNLAYLSLTNEIGYGGCIDHYHRLMSASPCFLHNVCVMTKVTM